MRLRDQFEAVVTNLLQAKSTRGDALRVDSLIASTPHELFEHEFQPEGASKVGDIRSISKAFVSALIGIAIDGSTDFTIPQLNLNTLVWPMIEDAVNTPLNHAQLKLWSQVTIEHLLTHTIGFDKGLMFSDDIEGIPEDALIDYVMNTPIKHAPGDHYVYSNVGPFLISIMLQMLTDESLENLCRRFLFDALGIRDATWRRYGDFTAGCTGLTISNRDMHRLGRCFADRGLYLQREVIPESWIAKMTTLRVETPDKYDANAVLPKFGYGLLTVLTDSPVFFHDGADAQYLIVDPSRGLVVSIIASEPEKRAVAAALAPLMDQ